MKQTKIGKYIEFIPALLLHCGLSILLIPMFVLIRYFLAAFSLISWNFTVILMLLACIGAVFIFFSKFNFRISKVYFLLEMLLIWLIIAGAFFVTNYSPKKIGGSDGARFIANAYSVRNSTLSQIRKKLDKGNVWISRGIYLFYIPAKISTFHAPKNQLSAYHRYLIIFQLISILITAYATYVFLRFTTRKEQIARAGALLCILCPVSYFWILDCQSDIIGIMYLASFLALLSYFVNIFTKKTVITSSHFIGKLPKNEKKQVLKTLFAAVKNKTLWYCIKITATFALSVFALVMTDLTRSLGVFSLAAILVCNFIAMPHQIRRHRWSLIIKICASLCLVVVCYFSILFAIRHYTEQSSITRQTTLSWLQFINDESSRHIYYNQNLFAKATPMFPKSEVLRRIFCSCLKKAANPRWLTGPWGPVDYKLARMFQQVNCRYPAPLYLSTASSTVKTIQALFILSIMIFPVFFGFVRLCSEFRCWNQVYQIPVLVSLLTVFFLFLGEQWCYHGVLWYYFFSVFAAFLFSGDWHNSANNCYCRQLFLNIACFLVTFGIIWAAAARFCPQDFRIKDFPEQLSRAGMICREKKFNNIAGVLGPERTAMTSRITVGKLRPNRLHRCSFVFTHPYLDKNNSFLLTVFDQDGKKIYFFDSNRVFFDHGKQFKRKSAPPVYVPITTNGNGEAVFTLNIEKTGEPFPLELTIGPVEMIPDGIAAWFNI